MFKQGDYVAINPAYSDVYEDAYELGFPYGVVNSVVNNGSIVMVVIEDVLITFSSSQLVPYNPNLTGGDRVIVGNRYGTVLGTMDEDYDYLIRFDDGDPSEYVPAYKVTQVRNLSEDLQRAIEAGDLSEELTFDIEVGDNVNHPSHYTSDPSGVECIEITRHRNFNIGNAIKYLWRNGLKNEDAQIEDLEKAIFYIRDEITRLQHEQA